VGHGSQYVVVAGRGVSKARRVGKCTCGVLCDASGRGKVTFRCFSNVSLNVCTIHTNAFFVLISLRFVSIRGCFYEQAMEFSVVR
jgi:hypothetical protein